MPPCIPQGCNLPQPGQGKNPGKPLPCDSDPGQTITNAPSLKSTFLVSKCMGLVMGRVQIREPEYPSPAAGVSAWSHEQGPSFCPRRLTDGVLPVSHGSILPRNLPLLHTVESLPSRNITATEGGSRGQQDSPGGVPSCPVSPSISAQEIRDSRFTPCRVSHSIPVSDLLPGEGLQVKPSISTASLAPALRALSIPCLPMGTAAAVAWSSPDFSVGQPDPTPLPPVQDEATSLSEVQPRGSPACRSTQCPRLAQGTAPKTLNGDGAGAGIIWAPQQPCSDLGHVLVCPPDLDVPRSMSPGGVSRSSMDGTPTLLPHHRAPSSNADTVPELGRVPAA